MSWEATHIAAIELVVIWCTKICIGWILHLATLNESSYTAVSLHGFSILQNPKPVKLISSTNLQSRMTSQKRLLFGDKK